VVAAFTQRFASIERDLDAASRREDWVLRPQEPGAILVRIRSDAIVTSPENALLYYPHLSPRKSTPAADKLVASAQAAIRSGNPAAALAAYDRLERLGDVSIGDVVGGIPAPLFAHLGRLTVREKQGDEGGRRQETGALEAALRSGQWHISEATYEFLQERLQGPSATQQAAVDDQLAVTGAVAWLWEQRTSGSRFVPSGRASRAFGSAPTLLVWRSSQDSLVAWIGGRRSVTEGWIQRVPRRPDLQR
jgi:hypothetical protein